MPGRAARVPGPSDERFTGRAIIVPCEMPPELGVYVHFPWCRNLCPYCDFPVAVARNGDIPHAAYRDAVLAELGARAPEFAGRDLVSIYFGGGTPSLWPAEHLGEVITRVCDAFAATRESLEITLEANPSDCTPANLEAWQDAGMSRLSIGVQSIDARTLVTLGRDHRMGDGSAAVEAAISAGFARISADVIMGTPGCVPPGAQAAEPSALALADAGVGHLSVYELTIEERTAFGRAARQGTLVPVDDEILASLYTAVHDALTGRGYEHYEISSYARPGQRAVHNQLYWRGAEFLGLGNGAASFRRLDDQRGERTSNLRAVKHYFGQYLGQYRGAGAAGRAAERIEIGPAQLAADRIWLGMRTSEGVAAALLDPYPELVRWLVDSALAEPRGDRICPTLKGFLFADRIASRVVAVCESG
jgi:putative oxygen-independent coproporphyrinogen III oxidase